MKDTIGYALAGFLVLLGGPAFAGSQCFKNLDARDLYVSLRYADGRTVDMKLIPGEKRRFNDVKEGDYYCYSFDPMGKSCANRNPVHLTSCSNPALIN